MFRQRFHAQGITYVAYCDYNILAAFDFRGCGAPSLQELETEIRKEVQYVMNIEGRAIDRGNIEVYFKNVSESRFPEGGVSCDALAIVEKQTMNRTTVVIGV